MASTKDQNGKQTRDYSINDLTLETLDAISDVEHSRNGEHPFKGYTAEALQKITINGKPVYVDIVTDPDTGEVIDARMTDGAKQCLADVEAQFADIAKKLTTSIPPATIEKWQAAAKTLRDSIANMAAAFNHFTTQEWRDELKKMRKMFEPAAAEKLLHEIDDLEPYIKAELKKPEYNGVTLDALMEYMPGELLDMLDDPNSTFAQVMKAARAAKADAEHVKAQHTKSIEYPIDKINGRAWNLLTTNTSGQIAVDFDMLPKKQDLQAKAYYAINFDDLGDNVKITKRLQPFDKRVYIAVSALYNAGNNVITATQIYYAMGGTAKTPSQSQINKINNTLSKMTGAKIILDNAQEAAALKRREHFQYDGSLLPIERMTAFVNGKLSESAIHIFREPPLMTFAKERNEITTINIELLRSPINKTDNNLSIDDYLIERISRAKHGDGKSCRILYKTLYEHIGITGTKSADKMARTRAPETIKKLLDHYKQTGFIKRHTAQRDGITVYF